MLKYCFLALLIAATPALAAEEKAAKADAKDVAEIVYRINLGRADDVKLLLEKGVKPVELDENGVPLVALAAARKESEGMEILKALVEAGADVNAKDPQGQTALFYAARKGNAEAVTYLLEHKVDYYATDNSQNIARTVAHNAGHKDIVKLMDDFVVNESEKVRKQYEDANKTIEERYKAQNEMIEKAQAELQKDADAPREKAPAVASPDDTYEAAADGDADEPPPPSAEVMKKRESKEFKTLKSEFARYNCAFQYWSYVRDTKQPSELNNDELDVAIDSNREHVESTIPTLMKDYGFSAEEVSGFADRAKQAIFKELEDMPSKSYRREQGVGRMDDMQERCKEIVRHGE